MNTDYTGPAVIVFAAGSPFACYCFDSPAAAADYALALCSKLPAVPEGWDASGSDAPFAVVPLADSLTVITDRLATNVPERVWLLMASVVRNEVGLTSEVPTPAVAANRIVAAVLAHLFKKMSFDEQRDYCEQQVTLAREIDSRLLDAIYRDLWDLAKRYKLRMPPPDVS